MLRIWQTGRYDFESVTIDGELWALSPAEVAIGGRLRLGDGGWVRMRGAARGAEDLRVHVVGPGGMVSIGRGAVFRGLLSAPERLVSFEPRSRVSGTVLGGQVWVQADVEVQWEPGCVTGPEICDGTDGDCDGAVDEDLAPPPFDRDVGVCAGLTARCGGVDGWLQPELAAIEGYEADERRCDGLDNDCDGLSDEPYPDVGAPCTAGRGICAVDGEVACLRANYAGCTARALPRTFAYDRICDGRDEDCDGAVDDDVAVALVDCDPEACRPQAYTACVDGEMGDRCAAPPEDEICDGAVDDDCDGAVDEGFDLMRDPAHCGRCNRRCSHCDAGHCAQCLTLRDCTADRWCSAGGRCNADTDTPLVVQRDDWDRFGHAVAVDGARVAVGAPIEAGGPGARLDDNDNSAIGTGAVYVFTRQVLPRSWNDVPVAYIKSDNAPADARFGSAVALQGDRLVVGARLETGPDGVHEAGAVYVFEYDRGWRQVARLTASNPGIMDRLGDVVALDGDRIAVGVPFEDGDAESTAAAPNGRAEDAGAVYVFERDADGNWPQVAYLKPPNATRGDRFGASVALHGDRLAIGAPYEGGSAQSTLEAPDRAAGSAGAVYVYTRDAGGWSPTAYLKASNARGGSHFGAAVQMDGDRLAVGSPGEAGDADSLIEDPNIWAPDAGAAYVFEWTPALEWQQTAYLKADSAAEDDRFGETLALERGMIVVGAPDGAEWPTVQAGEVFVFEMGTYDRWYQTYARPGDQERDHHGSAIALRDDVMVLGTADVGFSNRGSVQVIDFTDR